MSRSINKPLGAPVDFTYMVPEGSVGLFSTCMQSATFLRGSPTQSRTCFHNAKGEAAAGAGLMSKTGVQLLYHGGGISGTPEEPKLTGYMSCCSLPQQFGTAELASTILCSMHDMHVDKGYTS